MAKGKLEVKHTCIGHTWNRYGRSFVTCGATAKFCRGDNWYCGTHDPVAVKARKEKRDAKMMAEHNKFVAAQEKIRNSRALSVRKAAAYDVLLQAVIAWKGAVGSTAKVRAMTHIERLINNPET